MSGSSELEEQSCWFRGRWLCRVRSRAGELPSVRTRVDRWRLALALSGAWTSPAGRGPSPPGTVLSRIRVRLESDCRSLARSRQRLGRCYLIDPPVRYPWPSGRVLRWASDMPETPQSPARSEAHSRQRTDWTCFRRSGAGTRRGSCVPRRRASVLSGETSSRAGSRTRRRVDLGPGGTRSVSVEESVGQTAGGDSCLDGDAVPGGQDGSNPFDSPTAAYVADFPARRHPRPT